MICRELTLTTFIEHCVIVSHDAIRLVAYADCLLEPILISSGRILSQHKIYYLSPTNRRELDDEDSLLEC